MIDGKTEMIKVLDFNYEYFSTQSLCSGTPQEQGSDDEVTLSNPEDIEVSFVVGDIEIPAVFERRIRDIYLYKVKDFEKFYLEEHMRDMVMNNLLEAV